jgi:hypothetical protein
MRPRRCIGIAYIRRDPRRLAQFLKTYNPIQKQHFIQYVGVLIKDVFLWHEVCTA